MEGEEYEAFEKWKRWSAGSGLREGDRVLRRGGLSAPPYEVLVSATGLGFVCIEEWWGVGYGDSVTIVEADGAPPITKKLADLFTRRSIDAFPTSVSSIWWLRGAWIDDAARQVVVVSVDGRIRTIGWDDGAVGEGDEADIVRALALPYDGAKRLALELVGERRIGGAAKACTALLADRMELPGVRLRAATALAAIGDRRGAEFVLAHADVDRSLNGDDDAEYAIAHLPDVLGMGAIPRLSRALRAKAPGARLGFYALGHRALPALKRLAAEEADGGAIEVLGWLGAREAIPALEKAAEAAEDEWTRKAARRWIEELSGEE